MEAISFTSNISRIKDIKPIETPGVVSEPKTGDKVSFSDFLKESVEQVNQQGLDADKRMANAVLGNDPNPHETVIALQKAHISFTLLMSVKQRLEESYRELVRTQI